MEDQRLLFIGGEWCEPATDRVIEVVSPHTEEVIARVPAPSHADVDRAVAAARAAFDDGPWPRLDPAERVEVVRRLGEAYGERLDEMAELITAEMGSPISFSKRAQTAFAWTMLKGLTEVGGSVAWEEVRAGYFGRELIVRKEPIGVVAAIDPWNMPQVQMVFKLVPALIAGCSIVLKPAAETPLDAYVMADLIEKVGVPPGVVSILPGDRAVAQRLIEHPGVDKVAFTGSTAAGREVAAACGANLKRVSLELGGKSAAIVLDDAEPGAVADGIRLAAGLTNAGQICTAQARVLVPQARYREHADALAAMVESLPVGDPFDPDTVIGPLVAQRQQARVRGFIEDAQREGARLVVGGTDLPATVDRGWYIAPTLFTEVDNRMRIAQEEIFGPVLTVTAYQSDDEAVRIANDSAYGLSGSVWTSDVDRGLAIARAVRTGTFGVNGPYSMDPAGPFGGVKASGIGRELGREGIESNLEVKSISVAAPS